MAPKKGASLPEKENSKTPLGVSPAAMAKRLSKKIPWCPKNDKTFDRMCDPENPRTITYKDIFKAYAEINKLIPPTPLKISNSCEKFDINLHYKLEIFHRTGSFHERTAISVLHKLTNEQKQNGIITASLGNWGTALAYYASKYHASVRIVFPETTPKTVIAQCKEYGAKVILHGSNFSEAKRQAHILGSEEGIDYINGYDHPDAIAGSGSIGVEIMEQLPEAEVILVPVGGGGLLAGIAEYAKYVKPEILIYGVEPAKGCSFYKALENNKQVQTAVHTPCLAEKLLIPLAGCNSLHTAKSLISKMVVVDDDWIARAILEFTENERLVAEGSAATSLSALLAVPTILPELKNKTVVCVITSGNMDPFVLPRILERGKALDGRLIKLKVKLPATQDRSKIFSTIAEEGCNLEDVRVEPAWHVENNFTYIYLHLKIATDSLQTAASLKQIMTKLYPDMCEFVEEPFSPIPICACYPKKRF